MTCWKPGPPYGFISTGSFSACAYGLSGLGAMIAVYSWCSPSRVNVTFGVKPGLAAVDAIVALCSPRICRIWARAERISRPETTMPRSPREAVHWPGSVVTGVIVPL